MIHTADTGLRHLPHRDPIRMVRSVLDCTDDGQHPCLVARTPVLTDYPGASVYFARDEGQWPRNLITEAWCQAAAILLLADHPDPASAIVLISRLTGVVTHVTPSASEHLQLNVCRTRHYSQADVFTGTVTDARGQLVQTIESLTATARTP